MRGWQIHIIEGVTKEERRASFIILIIMSSIVYVYFSLKFNLFKSVLFLRKDTYIFDMQNNLILFK